MTKRLHEINTIQTTDSNETYLVGKDENGNEFTLIIPTIEILEWVDVDYMKQKRS